MALATKTESQKIFEKLKAKTANKVRRSTARGGIATHPLTPASGMFRLWAEEPHLVVCTVRHLPLPRLLIQSPQPRRSHLLCEVNKSRLYVDSIVPRQWCGTLNVVTVWQWDQLRLMKVGGNESATKYFQSHGGSAALASKDPKTKYMSNAATKYKEELARRVTVDAQK